MNRKDRYVLTFTTTAGVNMDLVVPYANLALADAQVRDAMTAMINTNILQSRFGFVNGLYSAMAVESSVEDILAE